MALMEAELATTGSVLDVVIVHGPDDAIRASRLQGRDIAAWRESL